MSIIVNKAAVRRTLEAWFIAARAGETLGAHETAKLSSAEAAAQSSDFFYEALCRDEDVLDYDTEPPTEFIAGEDIVAGQVVVLGEDGRVVGLKSGDADTADFFG